MSAKRLQHEEFSIQQPTARKKLVRQDRTPIEFGAAKIEINGHWFDVMNVSTFGIAVFASEKTKVLIHDLQSKDCTFVFRNVEIQKIDLRKMREEKLQGSAISDYAIGFEIVGTPLNIDTLAPVGAALDICQEMSDFKTKSAMIPANLKLGVWTIKSWLAELKAKVDAFENNLEKNIDSRGGAERSTMIQLVSEEITKTLPPVLVQLEPQLSALTEAQIDQCKKFVQQELSELLYGAPFAARAYYKPLGYAGDYQMMNHLYYSEQIGRTLYDQCLHKYFVEEPAGQAVKNRGGYLADKIKKVINDAPEGRDVRILSVASGPAIEMQNTIKNWQGLGNRKVTFVLIDQDEVSLKHAQRQLTSLNRLADNRFTFEFYNLAIKNIINGGLPEGDFDLIYSAGLFDYFSNPVATAAASRFTAGLSATGVAVIGNFSKENPSRMIMEMGLDWYLIHRSPEELTAIFAPTCKTVTIEKEPLGINLFAVLRK